MPNAYILSSGFELLFTQQAEIVPNSAFGVCVRIKIHNKTIQGWLEGVACSVGTCTGCVRLHNYELLWGQSCVCVFIVSYRCHPNNKTGKVLANHFCKMLKDRGNKHTYIYCVDGTNSNVSKKVGQGYYWRQNVNSSLRSLSVCNSHSAMNGIKSGARAAKDFYDCEREEVSDLDESQMDGDASSGSEEGSDDGGHARLYFLSALELIKCDGWEAISPAQVLNQARTITVTILEHLQRKWIECWGSDPALRLAAVGNTNAKLAVTSAARLVALGREGLIEVAAEVYGVGVAKVKKDLTDEEYRGPVQYLQEFSVLWSQLELFSKQSLESAVRLKLHNQCRDLAKEVRLQFHYLPGSNSGAERLMKRWKNLLPQQLNGRVRRQRSGWFHSQSNCPVGLVKCDNSSWHA